MMHWPRGQDNKIIIPQAGSSSVQHSKINDNNSLSQSQASSQRSRLLAGSEALSRTSDSVARSHVIAAETDAIGENIINDLGTQREQLVRTRDRVSHQPRKN